MKTLIHVALAASLTMFSLVVFPNSASSDPPRTTIGPYRYIQCDRVCSRIADDPEATIAAYQLPPPAPNGWDTVGWVVWQSQGGYQVNLWVWNSSSSASNPAQNKLVYSDTVSTDGEEMQVSYNSLYEATVYGKPLSTAMQYKYRIYNIRKTSSPITVEESFTPVMTWTAGSQ